MSLSDYRVRTSIAVSDIARAAEFYEGELGLSGRRFSLTRAGNTFALEQ